MCKIDSRYDVSHTERDLFCFSKKIIDIAVKHHAANNAKRKNLFRDEFRRIQYVEVKLVSERFVEELKSELPLREVSFTDRSPEIPTMKVRIGARDLQRFVPNYGLHSQLRPPVKLDKGG